MTVCVTHDALAIENITLDEWYRYAGEYGHCWYK